MKGKDLKIFEDIIKNSKNADIFQLEETVHNVIHLFVKLKDQLASADPDARKQAAADIQKLQEALQKEADKAAKDTGLSPEELHEYMQTPQNFSEEEWNAIQRAQKELTDYEKELKSSVGGAKNSKKTQKTGKKGKKRPPHNRRISG